MSYSIHIPGLVEMIAVAKPTPGHEALLRGIRSHANLSDAKLATIRGDAWLSRRKVVTAQGDLIHVDHEAWLREQADADRGNLTATLDRLKELDYRLTECAITTLYVVHDNGGGQDEFVQVTVLQEDEFIDRRLFSAYGEGWGTEPRDFDGLHLASEEGERLEANSDARRRFRPAQYRLKQVIDIARFTRDAKAIRSARREKLARRIVLVTDDAGHTRRITAAELDKELNPGDEHFGWSGQRLFDDWTMSSAGRSGARLCDHWVLQTADYTNPSGERSMGFVPVWTFGRKLAEIARARRSVYELYGKLESMDQRLKVPFGWYFYMLHGNRVHDWVAGHIIGAAEAGKIVLPEHDYRVLKRWQAQPYGF